MTGPTGGPAGSPGSNQGRPPESAAFEPVRIGAGRRRVPTPVLGVAFVLVLGAVVAAGLSDRLSSGAFPIGGNDLAPAASATPSPNPVLAAGPTALPTLPIFPEDTGPVVTSEPGPLQLIAKPHPSSVFIHGDVFVERVTWVFVSVLDGVGRVGGWASVSIPGSSGIPASGAPSLRFDVEIALPDGLADPLWAQAQAYDADGRLMGATRVRLPVVGASPAATRTGPGWQELPDDRLDWRG